jgi:hypothetical protein
VNSRKYKRIFISPTFKQTEWGTEDGQIHVEGPEWHPPLIFNIVQAMLVDPIPPPQFIAEVTPELHEQARGKVRLACVSLTRASRRS